MAGCNDVHAVPHADMERSGLSLTDNLPPQTSNRDPILIYGDEVLVQVGL